MLRFTDNFLKLISDIQKYQFVESTNRILYDASKLTSYIMYLGANTFHGESMMQVFSTEILDWVSRKNFNLDNYSNNS